MNESRWREPRGPLRVGISACLLGASVRYDGGHKRDRFLVDRLGAHVDWLPVCPEVEVGLGAPRPAIRLEKSDDGPRLVEPKSRADYTEPMRALADDRIRAFAEASLCGYVLKKGSPSCGLERVRVHGPRGGVERIGTGLFAAALLEALPCLPVEEEGRLQDRALRESFLARLWARRRLLALFVSGWTRGELVAFHTAHKLLLLAHSESAYRRMGRLIAGAGGIERDALAARYERELADALAQPASVRRHVNVLQHALGHLRGRVSAEARAELAELLERYRLGRTPRIAPLTLLRHHVRAQRIPYLDGQIYLEPYPSELDDV